MTQRLVVSVESETQANENLCQNGVKYEKKVAILVMFSPIPMDFTWILT